MARRTTCLVAGALLALAAVTAPSAQAAYVATFQEIGGNVVEMSSGSFDLTDLIALEPVSSAQALQPHTATFLSGDLDVAQIWYDGVTGPSNFGPGTGSAEPDSSHGDAIGIMGPTFLFAPADYINGAPLSETSTWLNQTFASLGLTPGTYVYSWGAGAHADTFTIDVAGSAPPVPEPSTWAMMLIGFTGLGYAALRRNGAGSRERC
jgi:PEP-CTERM motif